MEDATEKTKGVQDAVVNLMTQKMTATFEEGADIAATMQAVYKSCKVTERNCVIWMIALHFLEIQGLWGFGPYLIPYFVVGHDIPRKA